ncbi:hypothetical protein [Mesorhizobium sp. M0243]|uniref:hypothetical protein n=1 Tax=Mesorhizobium sp. M0243 TaxID=2956925 RepID=UPI00333C625C
MRFEDDHGDQRQHHHRDRHELDTAKVHQGKPGKAGRRLQCRLAAEIKGKRLEDEAPGERCDDRRQPERDDGKEVSGTRDGADGKCCKQARQQHAVGPLHDRYRYIGGQRQHGWHGQVDIARPGGDDEHLPGSHHNAEGTEGERPRERGAGAVDTGIG